MKKNTLVMILLMTVVLLMSGCDGNSSETAIESSETTIASSEIVYEFYDRIQFGQSKEDVDASLQVTPEENTGIENSYTYVNEETGFGVSALFDEDGLLISKTLFYPSHKDLAFLTSKTVTEDQADSIPVGSTYDEIVNILGCDGTQIDATQIPFEDNQISYIYVWVNPDGSLLQAVILTDGTTNNVTFYD
ncbi:hypothetical protein Q5O24_06500 [Eubacteriaceae bacterium ES3]|nr:hypothetical protein Q5O24_06500 [Eubacteriaceae bacterium ES3]